MTKGIAKLALLVIGLGLTLGNYWFTFGLWPKSWLSFVGFFLGGIVVLALNLSVDADDK